MDIGQQEHLVDQYLENKDKGAAIKLLFDLSVRCAKEKDFAKAEALRDRLYDVDPAALSAITKSSEIIDQEKSKSIDRSHLGLWLDFYDRLTPDATNTFYYALKKAEYGPDETIFEQGDLDSNLYFVNQGRLKMVFRKPGEEMPLKTLKPGDIAGEETFFRPSVNTVTLITLSAVKVDVLGNETFTIWKDKLPSLASALHDYCFGSEEVSDILEKNNLDRRSHKRFQISGKAVMQLLGSDGKPVGKNFRGKLMDIGVGGLAFSMKMPKEETARLLLGRSLTMKFILPRKGAQHKVQRNAKIVAVRSRLFEDHSVHVKFHKSSVE